MNTSNYDNEQDQSKLFPEQRRRVSGKVANYRNQGRWTPELAALDGKKSRRNRKDRNEMRRFKEEL